MYENEKLENLTEFIKRTNKSKSKIYRFYKLNQDLFSETVLKKRDYFLLNMRDISTPN